MCHHCLSVFSLLLCVISDNISSFHWQMYVYVTLKKARGQHCALSDTDQYQLWWLLVYNCDVFVKYLGANLSFTAVLYDVWAVQIMIAHTFPGFQGGQRPLQEEGSPVPSP